jgi:hypothetical protein
MAMAEAAVVKRRLTEEEFLRLPDDGRKYELVEGEAREVPAGVLHDAIVARIIMVWGISFTLSASFVRPVRASDGERQYPLARCLVGAVGTVA